MNEVESKESEERTPLSQGLPRILVGIVVVLVGVIFLLKNLGYEFDIPIPRNWWALFILIPAIVSFVKAWERIQTKGKLDAESGSYITGGVFMTLVAIMFLARLDFGVWWPLFVIMAGVAILLNHKWTRG